MTASSSTTTPSTSTARRLVLPFLETDPLFDVRWGILLLPVWWWLGVEQFIWPVLFGLGALKMLHLQGWRLRLNAPLRWFALFMAVVAISGLFIVEAERWLTFWRNFGTFVAGFLILLIVSNRARSWPAIERLLDATLLAVLLSGVMGLLAVMDIWRPGFLSLAGRLLPEPVLATSYGTAVAYRTLGNFGWFVGLGIYYRLNSFFLFSNHYSSVLVYAIPFLFYKLGRVRGLRRLLVGLGIVLLMINLIYTTGRVALLSLLGGALVFMMFYSLQRRFVKVLGALALAAAIWVLAIAVTLEISASGQRTGLIGSVVEAVDAFVFARGEGSYTSRFGVYVATVEGVLERPLFGWGTERDVEGLDLPAGSHSEYFAALYRQGLIGLLLLLVLYGSVWRATRPIGPPAQPPGSLLRYGRWFFITALVNSLLNDPNVDSATYVFLWLFIALVVATAQFVHDQPHDDLAPSH